LKQFFRLVAVLILASTGAVVAGCSEGEQEAEAWQDSLELARSDLNTPDVHSAFEDFDGLAFSNATIRALSDAIRERVDDIGADRFYGTLGVQFVDVRYPDGSLLRSELRRDLELVYLLVIDRYGNTIFFGPGEQDDWLTDPDHFPVRASYWTESEAAQEQGKLAAWVEQLNESGFSCTTDALSGDLFRVRCKRE
jgi:hypothetical protein